MKSSTMQSFVLLSIALITRVGAFPQYATYNRQSTGNSNGDMNVAMGTDHDSGLLGLGIPSNINLAPIVSTGRKIIPDAEHEFMEPGPGDIRGLCPGLNLMANHGYIPRNGITDMTQLAYGLEEGLGLAPDLTLVLIVFALKTSVDLTTMKMSIGGTDPRTDGPLSGLLGRAPGLFSAEAHDKYEIDGSLGGDDAYWSPNGVSQFNGTRWNRWRQIAVEKYDGIMSIPWNAEVRYMQYKECRETNPQCHWATLDQFAFYAAQNLISTLMPSAEEDGKPGLAHVDTIDTFFGYHKDSTGQYTRQSGRYPPGSSGVWYRRTVPHTLAEFLEAGLASETAHLAISGSNKGALGTWTEDPLQISTLADVNLLCIILDRIVDVDDTRYKGVAKDGLKLLLSNLTADLRKNAGC
ncbi:Chloroperoxidase [Melampsora americana]|nr:Chloroperoxidase [Melampsora americana]